MVGMTNRRSVDVRITGQVQGVYFRASCADLARQLGVRGWVSNEPDGSVAGHFEGEAEALDALLAWCHVGPPRGRVSRVDVTESAGDAAGASGPGFEAR
jgi:acylphosphatase